MRTPTRIAAAVIAAIGLPLLAASPALAEGHYNPADHDFGHGVNAANNWNFSAASVCFQEVAVVPVDNAWVADHVNHCANDDVVDRPGR